MDPFYFASSHNKSCWHLSGSQILGRVLLCDAHFRQRRIVRQCTPFLCARNLIATMVDHGQTVVTCNFSVRSTETNVNRFGYLSLLQRIITLS